MEEYIKYIQKLSIKKDDVLLLILPECLVKLNLSKFINSFEKMLPYKNKVVVVPKDVDIKVISKDDQKLLGEEWFI